MTSEPEAYAPEPSEPAALKADGPYPTLPTSIWVLAWASLAAQLVALLDRGARTDDETGMVVSALLGAVVIGFVSAGVVRARLVRVFLACFVLVLSLVAEVAELVDGGHAPEDVDTMLLMAGVATSAVALAALWNFCRSDWYRWQRTKPSPALGESIGGLVLIAVAVGVVGGITAPADDGMNLTIRVAGD